MAKTWFITGCSSGFGFEMAKLILENDGRLIATARNTEKIKQWENDYPERALVLSMDVTKQNEVEKAVAAGVAKYGSIDILINNAGYGISGAIEEISDAEYRKIFDTNVFGLLNVTRTVLPIFRNQKNGTVVNFSSIAGIRASAGLGAYSATKFAVEGISEALSEELMPLGVRVIIIEPGGFRTKWGGSSMAFAEKRIEDYDTTSGATKSFFASAKMEDTAAGDPAKLAMAVINIALHKNPPLRLALGVDSYRGIKNKIESVGKELEQWMQITFSTNY
jgi:NADP-dependent 3-hydroxy acid dehydrogenase YdfG